MSGDANSLILGFMQRIEGKLDRLADRVERLEGKVDKLTAELSHLVPRIGGLESDLSSQYARTRRSLYITLT